MEPSSFLSLSLLERTGARSNGQWFDKPETGAGRGVGFEMSCEAFAIRFVSSNAASVPARIWIWHPAWRTRYWFTRTTDSGILSVVLDRSSKVSLTRFNFGKFFPFFLSFLPSNEGNFSPFFRTAFLGYLFNRTFFQFVNIQNRSFSFGILFFWTIICNNFSSSNRIFCEYVVCFFILQVSSIKVLILKNYEIFFASRSPRISE